MTANGVEVTEDSVLGGRVTLLQPKSGYRTAIDPILLAAAIHAPRGGGRLLDLGCGTGAIGLSYLARIGVGSVTGIEIDPETADLARQNAAANGMQESVQVITASVADIARLGLTHGFDRVAANPPFLAAGAAYLSPSAAKRRSDVEEEGRLADWIDAMLLALKPRGELAIIHRADRVAEIIAAMGRRAGHVEIIPLWPRPGVAAKRVIVRARKGTRGPATLHPGLVLHEDARGYSAAAERILRDAEALY